jgi:hypothetical protein
MSIEALSTLRTRRDVNIRYRHSALCTPHTDIGQTESWGGQSDFCAHARNVDRGFIDTAHTARCQYPLSTFCTLHTAYRHWAERILGWSIVPKSCAVRAMCRGGRAGGRAGWRHGPPEDVVCAVSLGEVVVTQHARMARRCVLCEPRALDLPKMSA